MHKDSYASFRFFGEVECAFVVVGLSTSVNYCNLYP